MTSQFAIRLTLAYHKKAGKPHYQVQSYTKTLLHEALVKEAGRE